MGIYDSEYNQSHIKSANEGAFVRNLNEALNKKHEDQKQAVRTRRNMLNKYLAETGDKNVLHIAEVTGIKFNTLRRDLLAMNLHTKGGFIL